jgi:hypothetical protein
MKKTEKVGKLSNIELNFGGDVHHFKAYTFRNYDF